MSIDLYSGPRKLRIRNGCVAMLMGMYFLFWLGYGHGGLLDLGSLSFYFSTYRLIKMWLCWSNIKKNQ